MYNRFNLCLAKFMPLAEVIAIFFIETRFSTMLSAIILGERLGWKRLAANNYRIFWCFSGCSAKL